jgi:hypothetical protein
MVGLHEARRAKVVDRLPKDAIIEVIFKGIIKGKRVGFY